MFECFGDAIFHLNNGCKFYDMNSKSLDHISRSNMNQNHLKIVTINAVNQSLTMFRYQCMVYGNKCDAGRKLLTMRLRTKVIK